VESVDTEHLRSLQTIEQLLDYLLEFWGAKLFQSPDKFK
jgi:hypothetical protein